LFSFRAFRYDDFLHGEILGQGFFGKAVKVTHRVTKEVMVLKILNSIEPALEKSFLQEVSQKIYIFFSYMLLCSCKAANPIVKMI